jgi:hypothetical protein
MSNLGNIMQLAESDWWAAANEIMFTIIHERAEITKEDFFRLARKVYFTPHFMKEACDSLFSEFEDSGYIRRTGKTVSRERGGGILYVWERVTEE